ncbi:hypothetical protein ACRRTK_015541 [Alexandromys fortis]
MANDPQHPPSRRAGGLAGDPRGRGSAESGETGCLGGWPQADWGYWTPLPSPPPRPPPPCPRPRPQISAGTAGLRGASGTDLAMPAAGKAVRTRPGRGPSSPKGLRVLEQGAGPSARTRTFPARPDQVQSPKRWDQA